jgi:hypothetical protein
MQVFPDNSVTNEPITNDQEIFAMSTKLVSRFAVMLPLILTLGLGSSMALADVTPAPEHPGHHNVVAKTAEEHAAAAEHHKKAAEYHKGMAAHHLSMAKEHKALGHHKLAKHHTALAKHHAALAKEHAATAKTHEAHAAGKL